MIYEDTKQSICTQRKGSIPKLIKKAKKQTSKKGEIEEVIVTDGF
jgi:hypothetical protein